MKSIKLLLPAALLALASCGVSNKSASKTDSTNADTALIGTMAIKDTIKIGDSVILHFTVKNPADTAMRFCQWHTPFEPPMSRYLDIKDQNGTEMAYQGAMAKRMMPPPESSYIKLNPHDSVSTTADVLRSYTISEPGTYTIVYNGQNISGVTVKDSVKFVYVK